ncbi:MAG: hypothetical protein R2827_16735 [Bdellovibrionales bacterium]
MHPDSDEYKAFLEIVYNFRRIFLAPQIQEVTPERNFYIKKVIARARSENNPYERPLTHLGYEANYLMTSKKTPLYYAPTPINAKGESTMCGYLDTPPNMSLIRLKVNDRIKDPLTGVEYAEIELPKYDLLAQHFDSIYITLKDNKDSVNVRTSPESIGDTCRPDFLSQNPNFVHNCAGRWEQEQSSVVESKFLNPKAKAPFVQFNGRYPVVDYNHDRTWVKFQYANTGIPTQDFAWMYRPLVKESIDTSNSIRGQFCAQNRYYIPGNIVARMYDEPKIARLKPNLSQARIHLFSSTTSKVVSTLYSAAWRPEEERFVLVISDMEDNNGDQWLKVQTMHGESGFIQYRKLEISPATMSSESFNLESVIGESFEG